MKRSKQRRSSTRPGKSLRATVMPHATDTLPATPTKGTQTATHGFRPFPKRGGVVTNELINKLREGDAY